VGVTSPFELQFRGVGRREGCRAGQLCAGSFLEYFSASSNASAPTSAIHGQQSSTGQPNMTEHRGLWAGAML